MQSGTMRSSNMTTYCSMSSHAFTHGSLEGEELASVSQGHAPTWNNKLTMEIQENQSDKGSTPKIDTAFIAEATPVGYDYHQESMTFRDRRSTFSTVPVKSQVAACYPRELPVYNYDRFANQVKRMDDKIIFSKALPTWQLDPSLNLIFSSLASGIETRPLPPKLAKSDVFV